MSFKKNKIKPKALSRKDFIIKTSVAVGSAIFIPKVLFSQECESTTQDILGPYFVENAPLRTVIAHADEPGQRLFIAGRILQSDCETPIAGAMIEIWHANDVGCYSINLDCITGNPDNDYFNLRGKMYSNQSGQYAFETILPGYYGNRPRHIHIKITTPSNEVLISQIYFSNDVFCDTDPWCQNADDRIVSLQENNNGFYGELDFNLETVVDGLILGDVNFDGNVDILDLLTVVDIILDNTDADDFQMYAADINEDTIIDILDIIAILNIILNVNLSFKALKKSNLLIDNHIVSIDVVGDIAGIQLQTSGDFKITRNLLPDGWALHHTKDTILIFNQYGNLNIPKKLFEYNGKLRIVSNTVTGWNFQRQQADININDQFFKLLDPYPNPFNPKTNIIVNVKQKNTIRIVVSDIRGRELSVLNDGFLDIGKHSYTWNAKNYPTGIYFVKVINQNHQKIKKIMLVK